MKTKQTQPKFDAEGYQIGLRDLNGEALPDLKKARLVSRSKAGLPSPSAIRKALGGLKAEKPSTFATARCRAGLTQEEFAAAIGVKLTTYRQWEHGRRTPTGPARTLLTLLAGKPALIADLRRK